MPPEAPGSRKVRPEQMGRLQDWSDRNPVIAVLGEFSAGKSSLINFLLGGSYLPTQITSTAMPPVWLSYGDGDGYYIDSAGEKHPLMRGDLSALASDTALVRLFVKREALRTFDIMDLPGNSDPNMAEGVLRRAVRQSSIVIWCTAANQAWRQSERAAFTSLPQRLQDQSILVMTRADKLTDENRERVERRLERETGELFAHRNTMATPLAVRARISDDENTRAELWTKSGAAALLAAIDARVAAVRESREAMMARYAAAAPAIEAPRPIQQVAEIRQAPQGFGAAPAAAQDAEDQTGLSAVMALGSKRREVAEARSQEPAGKPAAAEKNVSRELAEWRRIRSESSENPTNIQLLSMIDQFIAAIFPEGESTNEEGSQLRRLTDGAA